MKRKASLNNLRDQILTLRLEQESIKACTADSEPVKGGGSKTEDRWIDNIVKTKRLSLAYSATRRIVAPVSYTHLLSGTEKLLGTLFPAISVLRFKFFLITINAAAAKS